MVELGVIQAVEQMNRAGPAGRDADSDFAGELGKPDRLERGHLLVPGLHELWLIVGTLPGGEQTIDAVPGKTEDLRHTPIPQPGQQDITDSVRHGILPGLRGAASGLARDAQADVPFGRPRSPCTARSKV